MPQIQIQDSGSGLQSCTVQYSSTRELAAGAVFDIVWRLPSLSLTCITAVTFADGNNEGFQKRTPQPPHASLPPVSSQKS
jgi:hypothetical protein